jgi:hypothetical protein
LQASWGHDSYREAGVLPISGGARERLDKLMNDRRLELGITWRDVAARAGLSYETLRSARTSDSGMRELTAAQIARALEWEPRAVQRILAGGEPQVAARDRRGIPADAPVCSLERNVLASTVLNDEQKAAVIREHRANGHDDDCTLLASARSALG